MQFSVRAALVTDTKAMAELFAAVAEERDGIATEPPVDVSERAARFADDLAGTVVAVAGSHATASHATASHATASRATGGHAAASQAAASRATGGQVIGMLQVKASRHGFGEVGMLVDRAWRGRGVGSALVQAAIDLAREQGLHKLSLEVFAHNKPAIALYQKCGLVEEGRRISQYRRASGELWDSVIMGLTL